MFLLASNLILYAILVLLVSLLIAALLARPSIQGPPKLIQKIDSSLLAPLPPELHLRMRRYIRGRALPPEIQKTYSEEVKRQHQEGMRRIRAAS